MRGKAARVGVHLRYRADVSPGVLSEELSLLLLTVLDTDGTAANAIN